MFCSNCGQELADDALVCNTCGAYTQYYDIQQETKKKFSHGFGRWIVMLLILAVVAAFVGVLYTVKLGPADPKRTIYQLAEGIEELDSDKIKDCFDAETQEMVGQALDQYGGSVKQLLELVGSLGEGPEVEFEFGDTEYQNNNACSIAFSLTTTHLGVQSSCEGTFQLVKEDDDWKIHGVDEISMILEGLY